MVGFCCANKLEMNNGTEPQVKKTILLLMRFGELKDSDSPPTLKNAGTPCEITESQWGVHATATRVQHSEAQIPIVGPRNLLFVINRPRGSTGVCKQKTCEQLTSLRHFSQILDSVGAAWFRDQLVRFALAFETQALIAELPANQCL